MLNACDLPFGQVPDCFAGIPFTMVSTPACAEAYSAWTGIPRATLLNVSVTVEAMHGACTAATTEVRSHPTDGPTHDTITCVTMHGTVHNCMRDYAWDLYHAALWAGTA